MLEFIKPGLETSVQDYPGRVGFWSLGIPPSGPMDAVSFQLANLAVGNPAGAPALEVQFIGPEIRFSGDTVVAFAGADMQPKLNGQPAPMWEAVAAREGDVLTFGFAAQGCRTYVAVAGGVDIPKVMDSCSTFAKAGIGGIDGGAAKAGTVLKTGAPSQALAELVGRRVVDEARPALSADWEVEVLLGPHDDWLTQGDIDQFLGFEWKVSSLSDRTGYRIEGPEFEFGHKAHHKLPENGSDPSNIIDFGYSVGSVNFCGQTPIILMVDGPSLGGFINPFTVLSTSLWKLGQAKPGDRVRFKAVSGEEARELRAEFLSAASEQSVRK
jgi:biotin-dependent carboxylase-like uncharacterized protein